MELDDLAGEMRAQGIPFVFATYPLHQTLSGEWPPEQVDWAHGVAAESGAVSVRLLEDLLESDHTPLELTLLPHDGHPSALGYGIAAHVIAAALLKMEPLLSHCSTSLIAGPDI
jgi:hypothetical protein